MPNNIDPDIPVRTRGIGQIESGVFVSLSYYPVRGGGGSNDRYGIVDRVNLTQEGLVRFWFDNEWEEKKIEVTIGPTIGESSVRSKKERWTTLGSPLRVAVRGDVNSHAEYAVETIQDAIDGRYEDIVAVAEVKRNSRILEWLNWSEQSA